MKVKKDLKIGKVYTFHHIRKGTFVGQLIGVERADSRDEADDLFLTVKYDVRTGTDQERLKVNAGEIRVSNLRPSLIIQIDDIEEGGWLRKQKVAKPTRPDKELLNAMRDLTAAVKSRGE